MEGIMAGIGSHVAISQEGQIGASWEVEDVRTGLSEGRCCLEVMWEVSRASSFSRRPTKKRNTPRKKRQARQGNIVP